MHYLMKSNRLKLNTSSKTPSFSSRIRFIAHLVHLLSVENFKKSMASCWLRKIGQHWRQLFQVAITLLLTAIVMVTAIVTVIVPKHERATIATLSGISVPTVLSPVIMAAIKEEVAAVEVVVDAGEDAVANEGLRRRGSTCIHRILTKPLTLKESSGNSAWNVSAPLLRRRAFTISRIRPLATSLVEAILPFRKMPLSHTSHLLWHPPLTFRM
mmetsp:Transcript_28250/g.46789  ORF Transcript_28250/g.46789 Transcript_28250/m.46789 type:complete len:213 (-) Transcript_28250:258-896(-)